ncbi:uncharacterized protein EV154DRAFT_601871 [Mucor mucedo]|uniref:uncharacterized protein n=1 Tax=Mucor mucedo TaxID=29922 RepID=UPI002220F7A9|nr:uncharacterized protein EV154DRAFT_601871 [Mucor mucedo]KAI7892129.1 hypothetical protein EV154DRAFT_601871 [Mucor mucedo]
MSETKMEAPRLVLRTYRASDHDQVDHLFYSTYFTLVPEGVKCKLKSPSFWIIWVAFYAYLLAIVPVLLAGLPVPGWASIALKIFMTLAWAVVSFAGVFVVTDRFQVVDQVEQARQNDLSDPEIYYLNWVKEQVQVEDEDRTREEGKKHVSFDKDAKPATEIVRTQKPLEEQSPSHFWVLTMDNKYCGMVGLAHYKEVIYSRRPAQPATWKLMAAALFKRYHLTLPESLSNLQDKMPPVVFARPHADGVASLERLTVKPEYQHCGLSTFLVDRAMAWAHEKGLSRVEAKTNELESKAATILEKRHGFKLVKKERKGWFGQYEKTWSCNVEDWIATHEEAANTYRKSQQ